MAKSLMPDEWVRIVRRAKGPLSLALALLLLTAILYGVWIRPLTQAIAAQVSRNQATQAAEEELVLAERAKRELAAMALSKNDLPQAINRVSVLGRRDGVVIPETNFQPATTASPHWSKVALQFMARGSYANLRKFLAALEAPDEPFIVESVSLEKNHQDTGLIGRFVVLIYARDSSS